MKIFYGVNGYGLGHLTRALSIIEHSDHEFQIFTSGRPLEYLKKTKKQASVVKIPGMRFHLENNHVNYTKTLINGYKFFKKEIQPTLTMLESYPFPDLVITDFEPILARYAEKWNIPCISIDNQHKFDICNDLPFKLKFYSKIAYKIVKSIIPNPDKIIISTFHHDCIESKHTLVNGLVRKSLMEKEVKNLGHILVYTRDSITPKLLDGLRGIDKQIIVYGSNSCLEKRLLEESNENVQFKDISPFFLEDLATCDKVISSSGNQLITECRYLNKPILTIPEPGQYEQHINGYYLEKIKLGKCVDYEDLDRDILIEFINNFTSECQPTKNGVDAILNHINSFLNHT